LVFHVLKANITQDASIVDEDINPAKGLDSGLNYLVTICDTIVVGYCLAACGFDLIDNYICCLLFIRYVSNKDGESCLPWWSSLRL
jgi:hypothetical protein